MQVHDSKREDATAILSRKMQPQPPPPVLSEDLMMDILSRLPVQPLLRFRCVCKCWNSLISSSHFVKKHLHRSATDPNLRQTRLLAHNSRSYCNFDKLKFSVPLQSLFDIDNPSSSLSLLFSSLPSFASDPHETDCKHYSCTIVGSCNGLVCWDNIPSHFKDVHYVCFMNPSTRLRSEAPWLNNPWPRNDARYSCLGFGYDHVTDTYKAVAIFPDRDGENNLVEVYKLGDKCWRTIQSSPYFPRCDDDHWIGIFVSGSGTLNWLADRADDGSLLVVSLDLGKETWKEVLLPHHVFDQEKAALESPKLWELGGCLCFSYDFERVRFVLWQMKEYGVEESWTELLNISYLDVGFEDRYHRSCFGPVFMLDKGEVLLQIYGDKFVLYDPRDNNVLQRIQIHGINWFRSRIHIDSLVSP